MTRIALAPFVLVVVACLETEPLSDLAQGMAAAEAVVAVEGMAQKSSAAGAWSKLVVRERESDVFVPSCAHAGSPLILALHAWAASKNLEEFVDQFSHAEYIGPECAVIVYPNGLLSPVDTKFGGYSWNAGGCCPGDNSEHVDDIGYLGDVITKATAKFGASQDNVFVVGTSNGGMMANRLACTDTRIKAMVAVAGPLINGTAAHDLETFSCSRRVPVLHFHGLEDEIIPFEGCSAEHGSNTCKALLKLLGNKVGTSIMPVRDYIADWRRRNGQDMSQAPTISFLNGTSNCTSSGDVDNNVTLCVVENQGHAYPGHCSILNHLVPGCKCSEAIDASYHAMNFFRKYMTRNIVV